MEAAVAIWIGLSSLTVQNTLVRFEELGGDKTEIRTVQRYAEQGPRRSNLLKRHRLPSMSVNYFFSNEGFCNLQSPVFVSFPQGYVLEYVFSNSNKYNVFISQSINIIIK